MGEPQNNQYNEQVSNSSLITMVNPKLDPMDQDRQIIGPDLNPNNLPDNLTL